MTSLRAGLAAVAAAAILGAGLLTDSAGATPAIGNGPSAGPAAGPAAPACGAAPAQGHARCLALYRSGSAAAAAAVGHAARTPDGLWPSDIVSAYRLPISQGAGRTVAVVDAFDNPKAESDLAAYRKKFALPACTTKNGCFRKVNQRGAAKPLPRGDADWAIETSLDLDAVSAACPKCRILLVESDSDAFAALGSAVNTAVRLGAKIVSNSYGGTEFNGISSYGKRYYTHRGVAIVASSGDEAFGPANFPAVWPRVTAVGGTSLVRSGKKWTETAWSGASSGCSAYIAKPTWQKDKHCKMRTVADVSAVSDPDTGFAVYDSYGLGVDNGWNVVGGTSLAAPLIAGMIGLAGNAASLGDAAFLYAHTGAFNDIVGGSNGTCGGDYLCNGLRGYDAPTGIGSPRGVGGL